MKVKILISFTLIFMLIFNTNFNVYGAMEEENDKGQVINISYDNKDYSYEGKQLSFLVDNEPITTKMCGIMIQNTVMLPIDKIIVNDILGAEYSYDTLNQKLTVSKGNKKIVMTMGSKIATVNGKEKVMATEARIVYNKTVNNTYLMVPVKFLITKLGGTYKLNSSDNTVLLTTTTNVKVASTTTTTTTTTITTTTDNEEGDLKIMGISVATVKQMQDYIKSVNPSVSSKVLNMIKYYISEGEAEGVRGDIAFAQSCLETGNFTFKYSAVTLSQNNFCGMGVEVNGMKGNSFSTAQIGIRAQIQHLKAYGSKEELNKTCVDPRFKYVTRGCAVYLKWLGIQENPNKLGWASGKGYGASIENILNKILKM